MERQKGKEGTGKREKERESEKKWKMEIRTGKEGQREWDSTCFKIFALDDIDCKRAKVGDKLTTITIHRYNNITIHRSMGSTQLQLTTT